MGLGQNKNQFIMRKIIFSLSLFLMAGIVSNAQNFGVKAGLNIANANVKDVSTSSLAGLQFGLVGNFDLSETIGFNTGLLYSQKGFKRDEDKVRINYLEIPLNLALQHDLGDAKLFAQAGPYIGIGLSAKTKDSDGDEYEWDFGSGEDDDLKRMDFGLNLGAGVEFNSIQIGANYGIGLSDIDNYDDESIKNGVFTISVTYLFGK